MIPLRDLPRFIGKKIFKTDNDGISYADDPLLGEGAQSWIDGQLIIVDSVKRAKDGTVISASGSNGTGECYVSDATRNGRVEEFHFFEVPEKLQFFEMLQRIKKEK